MFTIQEVNDDGAWNDFVDSSRAGTIFHTSFWLNSSPHHFARIAIYCGDIIVAGAVLQQDSNGTGTLGSIAPYLGPLYREVQADGLWTPKRRNRVAHLLATAIRERVPHARFFTSPWLCSLESLVHSGFAARLLYTTAIDVSDLQSAWNRFASNLRRNIRAAERIGLTVTETSDFCKTHNLVCKTFARQQLKPWFSLQEANSCWESLKRSARARAFVTCDPSGSSIATCGLVWDKWRSYYLFGGYDESNPHRGASSLALWHAIQFTVQELGLNCLDLEGSHIPSISRFFAQFGGRPVPYYLVWAEDRPLFSQGHN